VTLAGPVLAQPARSHPANQSVRGWPLFNLGENFAYFGSSDRKERWYNAHACLDLVTKSMGNHTEVRCELPADALQQPPPSTANAGEFTYTARFTQQNPFVNTSADTSGTSLASLLLRVSQ